jgi:hypothetical protein
MAMLWAPVLVTLPCQISVSWWVEGGKVSP